MPDTRTRAAAAASLLLSFALAACETPAGSASLASASAAASPAATGGGSTSPATPAATAPQPEPTAAATRVSVGEDERVVDLYLPPLAPGVKAPLLVLLHGNGESAFTIERAARAGSLSAREGVIIAVPPARGRGWNVMVSPSDPIAPSADIAYIVGLIDHVAAAYPIDRGEVFVAGFSMGAVASGRIACEFADRVTAVALDAGAAWSNDCSPTRPVPILVMHGTADSTFRIALADSLVHSWRELDGCSGDPLTSRLSDIASSEVNDACADGASVQYVRYAGVGHRWFQNPDATDVMWGFFTSLRRGP